VGIFIIDAMVILPYLKFTMKKKDIFGKFTMKKNKFWKIYHFIGIFPFK
jgi:hypothetical protein